jgi:hypothetical protein
MDKLYVQLAMMKVMSFTTLLEMRKILHTITPSFIDINGIGKLLTSTRKKFYYINNIQSEAKATSVSIRKYIVKKWQDAQRASIRHGETSMNRSVYWRES